MRITGLMVTAAVLIGLAVPAMASPYVNPYAPPAQPADRSVKLSAQERSASWDSEMGVGSYVGSPTLYGETKCLEPFACDATLVWFTAPGGLSIMVTPRMPGDVAQLRMRLHFSDETGAAGPEVPAKGSVNRVSQRLTASGLRPGYYLVAVEWFEGATDYAGTATLVPSRR